MITELLDDCIIRRRNDSVWCGVRMADLGDVRPISYVQPNVRYALACRPDLELSMYKVRG
jgi:hypothetical protein